MAGRYIIVDHDTPLLLPPNLREWVPENHLVHFVVDAVEQIDLGAAKVNERGTGDAQYPPGMLLGLLIYSYATGTFSSRQIERNSHDQVAVRYLCGDTHPDHDTICRKVGCSTRPAVGRRACRRRWPLPPSRRSPWLLSMRRWLTA
jgi:transposase